MDINEIKTIAKQIYQIEQDIKSGKLTEQNAETKLGVLLNSLPPIDLLPFMCEVDEEILALLEGDANDR